ncbi:MAG: hypothetical protein ACOCUL_04650 [Bacteroidota bacterium]
MKLVDSKVEFVENNLKVNVITKIEKLSKAIIETVEFYYLGKVYEATDLFNRSLETVLFDNIVGIDNIRKNTNFFRARIDEKNHFKKADLFHVRFELRHIVSTNRYSIPGFPALYLGNTAYVCWEEFNRPKFRNMWFSRITNTRDLKLIQIQRIEDCIEEFHRITPEWQTTILLRYFVTFPLTIASTIKVKHPKGNFKPEYIIPQLLLQYISKNDKIDGIKFPSTKVDYDKLYNVSAYNYVFPVKTVNNIGFCDKLIKLFNLTEPTSLEIEEVLCNPDKKQVVLKSDKSIDNQRIELIEGIKNNYSMTSFGKIEEILKIREITEIENNGC